MLIRFISSLLFFFYFTLGISSQNDLRFIHFGMDEGFSNSRANAIIQDRKGFIWVGTWNGLNRYDGYECVTFQPNFHDTTAISNREIVDLLEDSKGNVWIGTSNGLNCMNPQTGGLKTYPFKNRILSLCEDDNQNIWIGTWSGGLYKLVPSTGEITNFFANDIISDIHYDSRKILWVGSYNGLIQFDPQKGEFKRHVNNPDGDCISNSTITNIAESADGTLWVGTWGSGMDRIQVSPDGSRLSFTNYSSSSSDSSISGNVITKLYYDAFKNLWIGTWNNGLCLLPHGQQNATPSSAKFTCYQEDSGNRTGISGKRISALMVDKTGVLWVGGSDLACASIIETGIHCYQLPQNKLATNFRPTTSAITASQEQLWISCDHYILQYQLKDNIYALRKIYNTPNNQSYSTQVLSLAANSNGLWVGTDDAGLIFYPFTKEKLLNTDNTKLYNEQSKKPIPGNKIPCMLISRKYEGVIWLGTMQSGFLKLADTNHNPHIAESYHSGNDRNNCSDNSIRCLYEDNQGFVWIGTQNGLNLFDPTSKTFEKFYYSASDATSLNDNAINAILEDASGNVWVGTNSGLNKVMKSTNNDGTNKISFKGYPREKHIKNEIITNIIEDQSHNLWIRTYKGFVKFNTQSETIIGEYFSSDFENTHLSRNATISTNNNRILLANLYSFLTFHPDSLNKKSVAPNVAITDFRLFNESIDKQTYKNKDINRKLIPYVTDVELTYKEKMLTLVFSAMDYKNPKKNEYAYKLEGFDNQWNNIGSRNYATYTNIPHGKYTFKVKAKNSDGFWSQNETSLNIIISPPIWKTIWAYISYALAIAGIIYLINRHTKNKEKEKNKLRFEKMKTEELARLNEMKSFFFTDMTHEFKTPLTLILGPAQELVEDKTLSGNATKHAELITKNAKKLLRLVNQLMEFRKIEKGIADELHTQQYDINRILQEVYSFFKPSADSRKITFSTKFGRNPVMASIDPDKMEKVIFNLVSNAFKYSNDNCAISISSDLSTDEKGNEAVVIKVTDEGIGIAQEHQQKIFERFYQINQVRTQSTGGIGLFLAKTLVEQHGGTLEVESKLGEGSCFKISIPVNSIKTENRIDQEKTTQPTNHQEFETTTLSVNDSLSNERKNEVEKKIKPIILIIEDDADLNEFIAMGLSHDYQVIRSFNGKEALEKAEEQIPDLILSDIMMPEMDGFEFCNAIRKTPGTSHIPIIFLTAMTMQEDETRGLQLGAVDYIFKPFNLVSVKLKINNILANQKKMQARYKTEQILKPEDIELSSMDDIFLKEAVESINKHLDDPNFDVEAFSKDLNMSTNQAYRKLKALTGQTANEFIRNQRLKTAATLLIQRKRSISEIIYIVGFTSPSYFTRCFKSYFGCTPKEYIDQN